MNARELRGRTPSQQILGWRIATAARVFVLSLAAGLTVSAGTFDQVGALLMALVVIGAIASTLDAYAPPVLVRLIPVAEGMLAAALIASTSGSIQTLLPYFIAPPLAAGIRAGWVTCLNGGLATLAMIGALAVSADALNVSNESIQGSLTWLSVGVAAGLLASLQTRSLRRLEEVQAPYLEAHRLMTKLHAVSQALSGGLDTESAASTLVREIMVSGTATRVLLFVDSSCGGFNFLAGDDASLPTEADLEAAQRARKSRRHRSGPAGTAFPVRVGEHNVGVVLVTAAPEVSETELARVVEGVLEAHSVPLDTALLFDDVREVATAEERQRLAREIHDGVAQDVASLGYAIDELSATSDDPRVHAAARVLRGEVTRVVSELRHSIFDLRTVRALDTDLGLALRAYVEEAAIRSGLLGHVDTQVTGPPLSAKVQAELLRITQEAVSNVRKHADAENLWVSLRTDGYEFSLDIRDDGSGTEAPQQREGHYGLLTMRERADRVNAILELSSPPGGGTRVHVNSLSASPHLMGPGMPQAGPTEPPSLGPAPTRTDTVASERNLP